MIFWSKKIMWFKS